MAVYPFPVTVAYDPANGGLAPGAAGQVYELSDTAFATPLALTDAAGIPMAALTADSIGLLPKFNVDATQPRVVWKSGNYVVDIISNDALLNQMADMQARVDSLVANYLALTTDDVVAAAILDTASQTHAAVIEVAGEAGTGGGTVEGAALADDVAAYVYRSGVDQDGPWPATRPDYGTVIAVGAAPAPTWLLDGRDQHDEPVA